MYLALPLSSAEAVEVKEVCWVLLGAGGGDGGGEGEVHGLHGEVLPVEDLLGGRRGGVALRVHGDGDVHPELLPRLHLADDLLADLAGDDVVGQGVLLSRPGV